MYNIPCYVPRSSVKNIPIINSDEDIKKYQDPAVLKRLDDLLKKLNLSIEKADRSIEEADKLIEETDKLIDYLDQKYPEE